MDLGLDKHMDMTARLQAILKLARETLTKKERWMLNEALRGVHGFDFIDSTLSEYGFGRGPKAGKNQYHLRKDGEPIGNAVLQGDYQGMEVVPVESVEIQEESKKEVPWDAWYSSGHIYDEWEREQEAKED